MVNLVMVKDDQNMWHISLDMGTICGINKIGNHELINLENVLLHNLCEDCMLEHYGPQYNEVICSW